MGERTKITRRKGIACNDNLRDIPNKKYFTISETAVLCGVKPYVLRFWEKEFSQLSPNKRKGNRRYYQYDDLILIKRIRKLLYEDGFTIEGAIIQLSIGSKSSAIVQKNANERLSLAQHLITELENLLDVLKSVNNA